MKRLLEDMEAIFGHDITCLEGEDRDDVSFESWLADCAFGQLIGHDAALGHRVPFRMPGRSYPAVDTDPE